jgi:hypothetical protein
MMQEKGHKCNDNFPYAGSNNPTYNPFLLNIFHKNREISVLTMKKKQQG